MAVCQFSPISVSPTLWPSFLFSGSTPPPWIPPPLPFCHPLSLSLLPEMLDLPWSLTARFLGALCFQATQMVCCLGSFASCPQWLMKVSALLHVLEVKSTISLNIGRVVSLAFFWERKPIFLLFPNGAFLLHFGLTEEKHIILELGP